MAEFQASLEQLQALTSKPDTPATPTTTAASFGLSPRFHWVTKRDLPSLPEIRRVLWAGVRGELTADEEELGELVRELTAARGCFMCTASAHPSMAPGTPWAKVRLCKCPLMASKEDPAQVLQKLRKGRAPKKAPAATAATTPSLGFVDVLPGWLSARQQEDGGIAWLRESLKTGDIKASTVIYKKTCRCGADFPIYALTIDAVISKYDLKHYMESNKCLLCARQAELRRQERDAGSPGVVPQKHKRLTAVRDVVDSEATQSAGVA